MWGRFWAGVLVVSSVASSASADRTLDKPAFTATPSELLALANAAPTGGWSVLVLRDQREVSYDDKGRATTRVRRVYVVQTQDGIGDDEDGVYATWRPSYQDRPVVRARVIAPTGSVAELDPALVTDAPGAQRAGNAVGARRYLNAPLPVLQVGAVVEQEIVTTDREPPPAGSVDTSPVGNGEAISSIVISYSAPASSKVHHVERKLPPGARTRHQIANGRESWITELQPRMQAPPAPARYEAGVPRDVVVQPYVGVGTAASWEAVARAYRKLLDQRIAEGPSSLPAELPRAASLETVNAITAWVHHQIRETGVGFDEAYLPQPPDETVKQGRGSCSDEVALLVALLRHAGIRADVALIHTRLDRDLDPDLPGLEAFNHALVRARIAARDVWIDATEPLVRPGQLPERDQGRRVLVIADDTKGLSMTPMAAPADNVVRDVRTFVAAEYGPSQLTQVVGYTGIFEGERRSTVRASRADLLNKQFARHAEAMFSGALERVAPSDVEDLATPFEMTLTVKDVHRVYTAREHIEMYLYPMDALDNLPWPVTQKVDVPRVNDFAWSRPQIYEVENRIVIPPGFTLPAPAPERIRTLGTAKLIERQRVDGQSLIVTFRFESGKLRLTPAELAALQTAVSELREDSVHLKIEHTAFKLSYAGKPREAIAECERLIAMHPKEAIHHGQLSEVLLRAGAGEAARWEARKAVALGPADADALAVLGWVLTFDTLGRPYTYDWDRAGAITVLQQAHKLAPKHVGAAEALAQVLQHGSSGRVFEGDADLAGAAEAWRAVLALSKTDENALALANVLMWSGQFAEAEKVARTAQQTDERDKWIVAAVAGGSGAAAASAAASSLRSGASRGQVLATAGSVMMLLQRYDVARTLFVESGAMAQMPQTSVAILDKIAKHPPIKRGTSDPRSTVVDVIAALFDPQYKTPAFWDADLERGFRGAVSRLLPAMLRSAMTAQLVSDVVQSIMTIEIEGDAGVWRATVDIEGRRFKVYLALDHGIVKLVGASDALSSVGRYILRTLDGKTAARARRLLDWIRDDNDKPAGPDVLAFKMLWGKAMPSSPEGIMLAAAVLANSTEPDRVIEVASRCASTLPDAELVCHELLSLAYGARDRWAEAVEQIDAILRLRPDRAVPYLRRHAWALAHAGRFDDADKLLDDILAKDPDSYDALVARFEVTSLRGTVRDALARGDAVVKHPQVTPIDLNNVAWYQLCTGSDLEAALARARQAADQAKGSTYAVNTLAAIEAEVGQLDRAVTDYRKAMELRTSVVPDAADWYVIGRIDEQLGLVGDAIAAYQRIGLSSQRCSSYSLAQKRLAALPVPATPAPPTKHK